MATVAFVARVNLAAAFALSAGTKLADLGATAAALEVFGVPAPAVTARLLPALEDQGGAKQLGTHLQALSAHLAAGNRGGAERALTLAQSSLSRQGSRPGDAADLGSIQLVLDGADALLRGEGSEEQQ